MPEPRHLRSPPEPRPRFALSFAGLDAAGPRSSVACWAGRPGELRSSAGRWQRSRRPVGTVCYDYDVAPEKRIPQRGFGPGPRGWAREGRSATNISRSRRSVFLQSPSGRRAGQASRWARRYEAIAMPRPHRSDLNSCRFPIERRRLRQAWPRCPGSSRVLPVRRGRHRSRVSPRRGRPRPWRILSLRVRKPGVLSAKAALKMIARQPRLTNLEILNIDPPRSGVVGPAGEAHAARVRSGSGGRRRTTPVWSISAA